MNFVLPPIDPNVPIRETEPMRLAKEAILKLTFSEMMALGINLSFVIIKLPTNDFCRKFNGKRITETNHRNLRTLWISETTKTMVVL